MDPYIKRQLGVPVPFLTSDGPLYVWCPETTAVIWSSQLLVEDARLRKDTKDVARPGAQPRAGGCSSGVGPGVVPGCPVWGWSVC